MKKVLIISASPRKNGNSDLLCDRFAQGAKESGHAVEKVFTAAKNIGYCRGCGVCNATHRCVQKDDMADILDKMVQADVILLATPVYFYSMDGQMKPLSTGRCRGIPKYGTRTFILSSPRRIRRRPTWRERWRPSAGLRRTASTGPGKRALSMAPARGESVRSKTRPLMKKPTKWAEISDTQASTPSAGDRLFPGI